MRWRIVAALPFVLSIAWAATLGVLADEPTLEAEGLQAFTLAVEALEVATQLPRPWTPDTPGWRDALTRVREAIAANPQHPAAYRLQFRAYALLGWWSRALDAADGLLQWVPEGVDPWRDSEPVTPEGPATRALVAQTLAGVGIAQFQPDALEALRERFEGWVVRFPDAPDVWRWLGRLRLEAGDAAGAVEAWEAWQRLRPDASEAQAWLDAARFSRSDGVDVGRAFLDGWERFAQGDSAAAVAAFERARSLAPAFAQAHAWLAQARLAMRDLPAARDALAIAIQLQPDNLAWRHQRRVIELDLAFGPAARQAFLDGLQAYELGGSEAALTAFNVAVGLAPRFVEAWAWLGRVARERGLFATAVEAWQRVVLLDPSDAGARGFLEVTRVQAEVASLFRTVAATEPFARARMAFEQSDLATARTFAAQVVVIEPGAAAGWRLLGQVAYAQQDYAEAARAYRRALEFDPSDEDAAWFASDAEALVEELRARSASDPPAAAEQQP